MASSGELKKSITWLQGTAMTIGAVIGAGILVLPAIAADIAGPASLASWLLMGLISLPMLAAIAQMSSRYPNSGGIAAYAQQAFGVEERGRLLGMGPEAIAPFPYQALKGTLSISSRRCEPGAS